MARDDTTQIRNDGLRYKSKKGGSPFGTGGRSIDTMSCIKCGRHKPRSDGSFKRMLGSTMFICFDCKPAPVVSPAIEPSNLVAANDEETSVNSLPKT